MAYPFKKTRFVHEFSRLAGETLSDLLAMAAGEEELFWFGLDYIRVVRLSTAPLYTAQPLSLSGDWHKLSLEPTITAFNGRRWWYVCPVCGKRSTALFWRQSEFGCRKCLALRYKSQYETFNNPFDRLCARVRKERVAIWGASEPDVGFLMRSPTSFKRPKGMRKKTFMRKLERLKAIEFGWDNAALIHLNSLNRDK